jgi:hypothetical protein
MTQKRATRRLKKMQKVLFQYMRKTEMMRVYLHLAWKGAKPTANKGVTLRTMQSEWVPRLLYPMHDDD